MLYEHVGYYVMMGFLAGMMFGVIICAITN